MPEGPAERGVEATRARARAGARHAESIDSAERSGRIGPVMAGRMQPHGSAPFQSQSRAMIACRPSVDLPEPGSPRRTSSLIQARRGWRRVRIVCMANGKRVVVVIKNGKDLRSDFRALPPGCYVVETVDDASDLSPVEEAGIEVAVIGAIKARHLITSISTYCRLQPSLLMRSSSARRSASATSFSSWAFSPAVTAPNATFRSSAPA
jgi:hypothetical protein